MLNVYEENPTAIDSGLLSTTGRAVDVRAADFGAYRTMKTRVYAEDSPLRADHDVWAAIRRAEGRIHGFYKSTLTPWRLSGRCWDPAKP